MSGAGGRNGLIELRRLSPSQRVFLMPAVVAVTLGVLFLMNTIESRREKAILSRIVDAGIPALEIVRTLSQSLELFQRSLQDAVAASDVNAVSAAEAIEKDMFAQIGRGQRNALLDGGELSGIDRELRAYCSLARVTSLAMIEAKPGIDLTPTFERMTKDYNGLKSRLETLSARTKGEMSEAFGVAKAMESAHARVVGLLSVACLVLLAGMSLVVGRAQERIAGESLKSQRLLAKAQRAAHVGSWELDIARNEAVWSDELFRILGLEPGSCAPTRERFFEGIHPEDRAAVEESCAATIRTGESCSLSFRVVRPNGEIRSVDAEGSIERDATGRVARFFAMCQDVSERRDLEGKLRQSQKMEAIGRLAGGVAHDFNNLLTVIQGYTGLLQEGLPRSGGERNADAVEQVRVASDRAAALTRQLLAFSRQQVLQPKVLRLNTVVTNLVPMLRRMIGEDIALETSLEPQLPSVLADAGQIEQVIMNLVVNARDAMPRGGRVVIETRVVEASAGPPHPHAGRCPYVTLAVRDTGVGMTPEVQARIFEPYFTTKDVGKGTGLGLATVHGIVQQSDGFLRLESEPGRGTTFRVYLPIVEDAVAPAGSPVVSGTRRSFVGSWTILLIEDEEQLRNLVRRVLAGRGFEVLTASNGVEALEASRKHDGPIHLLLSDVVMPGAGGPQIVSEIQAYRPEAEALFMSGYADDAVVRHGLAESGVRFLQKPFTPGALLKSVQDVLAGMDVSAGQTHQVKTVPVV